MRVHFIAVSGTGMGSLAGLFKEKGHEVSGSDTAFHPPMGPALERWGIRLYPGFDAAHLDAVRPELVVVGNVCRPHNPEARAAIDGGYAVTTMAHALAEHVLAGTSPLVVSGTHGKTTTTALAAHLLHATGREPGFLVGGLPANFDTSFRVPKRRLPRAGDERVLRRAPFVVEGDEYDTAFFEKTPKFWHYRPEVAIVTAIEHDHIDIYPDEASYVAAFSGFLGRVPDDGLVVACANDARVVEVVRASARARVVWYGLEGRDFHGQAPDWVGAPAAADEHGQSFDLYAGGSFCGRAGLRLSGAYNVANAVAALGAVCEGYGVPVSAAVAALPEFLGVKRRQELRGEFGGVRLYDDFAHHPTAVGETLTALRQRHREGRLIAVYEPRSATACRRIHEDAYTRAFDAASAVVLAPVGRSELAADERLDIAALAAALCARGIRAETPASIDAIVESVAALARPGDTVAVLSNGAFGGVHEKLGRRLAEGALRALSA